MRITIATFALLVSSVSFASAPQPDEPPQVHAIRAALPSYVPVPKRQLESKKFQRFLSDENRDKAWTSYALARPYTAYYNIALQAKTTYPGRTFVIRKQGSTTEYLKSPAPKK